MSPAPDGPIERYLDELVAALAGRPPRELRALLAEAEAHLYDETADAVSRGVSPEQAERDAVARFGPASDLAAAERALDRAPPVAQLRQLVNIAVLLAGIGAVAVGLSGLVAGLVRLVGGAHALVGVPPGANLSPADCTRWLALDPGAGSCQAAAVADWANETVYYRLGAGVLGVLLLVAAHRLRRGRPSAPFATLIRDTVGFTAFAVGAGATSLLGIDSAVRGTGAGQWLTGAAVALPAALAFLVLLLRDIRDSAAPTAAD